MRSALMSLVVGAALTIGTQGIAVAASPASSTIVARQSTITVDPSTISPASDQGLSDQPVKDEPDSDTNSPAGD